MVADSCGEGAYTKKIAQRIPPLVQQKGEESEAVGGQAGEGGRCKASSKVDI